MIALEKDQNGNIMKFEVGKNCPYYKMADYKIAVVKYNMDLSIKSILGPWGETYDMVEILQDDEITCNKNVDKSSCDTEQDAKCSWCEAGAVKDACHSVNNAKKLPPAVFDCDNLNDDPMTWVKNQMQTVIPEMGKIKGMPKRFSDFYQEMENIQKSFMEML